MLIAYDTMTGNVRRFIQKLQLPTIQIEDNIELHEDFILITYTKGFGEVPEKTENFLERNHQFLQGVSASGNRNWGANFAISADKISEKYQVPVVSKFELSGVNKDVEQFVKGVEEFASYRVK